MYGQHYTQGETRWCNLRNIVERTVLGMGAYATTCRGDLLWSRIFSEGPHTRSSIIIASQTLTLRKMKAQPGEQSHGPGTYRNMM